ncbi:recombinase RecT [Bacillus inaquosorum]|uniref:recombinase RecT n=1 Tax=Bacillus inaquosorum TaxID=483913 RepID=UPI0022813730|nr:recombinase RecT [Bacillus inaquosorum]MCY9097404.1 recombinase RecT [Bacillus inaquosorum]
MSNTQVATTKKNTVVEQVTAKVQAFQQNGEIHFPPSYSPENALKSAYLMLQNTKTSKQDGNRPVLEACTKESIANSLLDMVVQGLNPMKKQGYFIAYGNVLTFQRSYMGTMAVTKRVAGAKEINAQVIYEGDDVEYEMDKAKIVNFKHKTKFGNINKDKIVGAYCVIEFVDKSKKEHIELMTIEELRKAWSKAQFWSKDATVEKKGSTHDEYKQEMAKKTVINRACKRYLNSSDDDSLLMNTINQSDESAYEAATQAEIQENANSEVLDVEYEEVQEDSADLTSEESDSEEQQSKEEISQGKQSAFESGPDF